ncbi:hypothetical protein [Paenibacillus thalictri]|uniref:Uncharacterized protein n=1 Tax=Paenibacillus thalictri TaxID=2527873 RepID=A0A4Q9DE84_9BACL|nr:hypothetical protein [Paenibacillus thalictri]TBL67462.1 hypothetical protein EYB31_39690 [Paenibacillus thalictri]
MQLSYLYHYYEAKNGPFNNLSALSNDEAQKVIDHIRLEGKVFASKRSEDYLIVRRELEEKVRDYFIRKGGKPKKIYPHYMTLGECNWLKEWYTNGKELKIDIEEFDPESISFTYGDLFPTMRYKDGKPYREKLYLKDEIIKLIEIYGLPQEWNKDGKNGPERYIEVQVWDDEVIGRFLKA